MTSKVYNVLFLCNANSARSQMAEAIMQREGRGKFKAFSAGARPSGVVHAAACSLLAREGFDLSEFRSKSWDEFTAPNAPKMDFVITLCRQAAGENCPIWPDQPLMAHWDIHDPTIFEGNEAHTGVIFAKTYAQIRNRITVFANLPIDSLNDLALKQSLHDISDMPKDAE